MHEHCHRCGGEFLTGNEAPHYCPHCGAPQLYLPDLDLPEVAADGVSTGALPPPHPRQVDWKTALRCAVLVAGVAGVLSLAATRFGMLSPLSELWILGGSLTTLTLYQHRRPLAWMDAAVGARIGLLVGLSLVLFLGVSMAIAGLVARYGLHSMGPIDANLNQQMQVLKQRLAEANPTTPEMLRSLDAPEFRAGFMLAGAAMLAGFVLVLSTAGGAVAGLLRATRPTPAR